jgi:DNA polymerase I
VYEFLEPIYELFAKVGICFFQPKIHEADDVLCSIARKYGDAYRVINGTSDKDAYQYLSDYIQLYDSSFKDPVTKETAPRFITKEYAENRKGVRIDQMVDFQTLIGDRGDSIPPIKGYGPVTAKKLLDEHGTLQNWYKQSEGKERRFIRENLEYFRRNRKLVQLVDDCLPPSDVSEWKMYKEKPDLSLPGSYHDFHSILYPKTKGLFAK